MDVSNYTMTIQHTMTNVLTKNHQFQEIMKDLRSLETIQISYHQTLLPIFKLRSNNKC